MRSFFTVLLLCSIFTVTVKGQKKDSSDLKLIVSITPQYIFINSLKLDFEFKYRDGKDRILINPMFTSGAMENNGTRKILEGSNEETNAGLPRDRIKGFGLEFQYKYNFLTERNKNTYFIAGMDYRQSTVTFSEYGWNAIEQDGFSYLEYGIGQHKGSIQRLGYTAALGIQQIQGFFVVDVYAGLGYKNVKSDPEITSYRNFDSKLWGYSRRGFYPLIGIKFGMGMH